LNVLNIFGFCLFWLLSDFYIFCVCSYCLETSLRGVVHVFGEFLEALMVRRPWVDHETWIWQWTLADLKGVLGVICCFDFLQIGWIWLLKAYLHQILKIRDPNILVNYSLFFKSCWCLQIWNCLDTSVEAIATFRSCVLSHHVPLEEALAT